MKVSRNRLTWFLKQIRYHAEGKELSDEQLIDQLASYMETNPGCIDINGVSDNDNNINENNDNINENIDVNENNNNINENNNINDNFNHNNNKNIDIKNNINT